MVKVFIKYFYCFYVDIVFFLIGCKNFLLFVIFILILGKGLRFNRLFKFVLFFVLNVIEVIVVILVIL